MVDVGANWARLQERVAAAALGSGRAPGSVRIVVASKTQPVELIERVIAAGASDIGENYVQEAAAKAPRLPATVRWHMIGQLQRNKARRAVDLFDLIHTLDSVVLGQTMSRHGEQRGRAVRVLIEVNVGGESSKNGVAPDAAPALVAALGDQSFLRVEGLMAVPPAATSAESVRPYFRQLRALRDQLAAAAPENAPMQELSMGMSDDFEVAIEEGATLVRIGRAIFGPRDG
jgi:pyridoxal phosphate enzyme (YggS family)